MAVEAAARAVSILLRECARLGGPRGPRGKCPADDEAEGVIRGLLLSAFPSWGYRGEEAGWQAPAEGDTHVWVVDPNDGTSAMQRGFRGSAVSIGLLHSGVPVLGAVHGREVVPAQWRRMVLSARPMPGYPHIDRPRPALFWPADALALAERLLG